jgi:hypothetical protein
VVVTCGLLVDVMCVLYFVYLRFWYVNSLEQVLAGTVYCCRYLLGQSIAVGTGWDSLLQQVLAGPVYCSRYWLGQSNAAGTSWDSLFQQVLCGTHSHF